MKAIINCIVIVFLSQSVLVSVASAKPTPPPPPTRPTPPTAPVRPSAPATASTSVTSGTNNNGVAGTPVTTTGNTVTVTINCSADSNCG
ncbi:hypothetical protein [Undibacterium sp. TJN19]|uniref:hypothetical protein n=1 Tax=Undibacterium sp. TJN19 TaxID=3413055 RepID=UPI003BF1989A